MVVDHGRLRRLMGSLRCCPLAAYRWTRSPASARRRAWGTSSTTPTACSVPGRAVLSTGAWVVLRAQLTRRGRVDGANATAAAAAAASYTPNILQYYAAAGTSPAAIFLL